MDSYITRVVGSVSESLVLPRYRSPYQVDGPKSFTEGRVGREVGPRQAGRILRQLVSAQRYLDTAEVILLALDLHGRITLINRKGRELLGRTEQELLGCDWIETCLPPRVRDALRRTFANLVSGDLSVVENPILTRTGEERLIEWHNTLLRDDEGHVIGTFSSGADITERQWAEVERQRLNAEIEIQRLRVFRATMRTVQDIVNNLLNGLQLVHLEAESQLPPDTLMLVDRLIKEAAVKLKALGDLETLNEKEMAIGPGIDYPNSSS